MRHFETENTQELTSKQTLAVSHAAASPTTTTAGARDAGVSRATLNRWMEEPNFRAELERTRREAVSLAYAELQGLALRSVSALATLLEDPDSRVRASAVRTSFYLLRKIEADHDLRRRLDTLDTTLDLLKDQR